MPRPTKQQRLDEQVMRALIEQVLKAARGGSERDVVTYITRPMWRAFIRGTVEGCFGDGFQALPPSVFGSRTIIIHVENEHWSVSFHL